MKEVEPEVQTALVTTAATGGEEAKAEGGEDAGEANPDDIELDLKKKKKKKGGVKFDDLQNEVIEVRLYLQIN